MERISKRIGGSLALVLAILTPAGSAPAQTGAPLAEIPRGAIRAPCCRCIGGRTRPVRLDTGAAAWRVANPGSSSFTAVANAANVSWVALPPARWVGPPTGGTATGDFTYQLQIYVPSCTLPGQVSLSGRFAGDNTVRVFFDETSVAQSGGTANYGFLPGSVTPFSVNQLTPGLHTLRVVVTNSGGPTGVVIEAALTVTCPREMTRPD